MRLRWRCATERRGGARRGSLPANGSIGLAVAGRMARRGAGPPANGHSGTYSANIGRCGNVTDTGAAIRRWEGDFAVETAK
ncbi:hypothetical protein ACFPES_34590 [Paenibacillus sp. GCM10023248]|uniref:hypothetical protein n=1 Tax=Bacillales TaxID=1385 RepID=UPI002379BA70|nr:MULTISPECIES: hypothetical protein [Bacillales]MDD9272159.1 hypothetical protein [Paenibacillus sp. MAHUQ-63]MDR6885328.1 hypothetical protein [Bacillus sp. 3255]